MTIEQTAQQLELAAQILRTGHPWGYRHIADSRHKYNTPIEVVADGNTLSPLLATPPDGRPLHNPDNLTAEQVGVGYRLLLPVELDGRHKKACEVWNGKNDWSGEHLAFARYKFLSYRLPLSVPWPEPEKPDLYAELKAAHAAGKVVQVIDCGKWLDLPTPNWCEPVGRYRIKPAESAKPEPADPYAELKAAHATGKVIQWFNGTTWLDLIKPVDPNPLWLHPAKDLRIKPEEPAFQLPPCAPGMRWHREDGWTADDLPQGYRPLAIGEGYIAGDQYRIPRNPEWRTETFTGRKIITKKETAWFRTTRLLTFEHAGKTWTWHRPGDPTPCDGERMVHILTRDNDFSKEPCKAEDYEWSQIEGSGRFAEIIGWRYAEPQTKTVPLGPEDVPPGSVFGKHDRISFTWHQVIGVYKSTIKLSINAGTYAYEQLVEDWQINRSIPLTGKWNPDAWEPCHKKYDC